MKAEGRRREDWECPVWGTGGLCHSSRRMPGIMPTTYSVDMSKWAGTDVTGPITVTYDGASPADPGPAGVVLRMLMAQASNDEAGLRACVTAKTMEMGKPAVPGKELTVNIGAPAEEGDRRVVNAKLSADG